jgi:hypothetical protein
VCPLHCLWTGDHWLVTSILSQWLEPFHRQYPTRKACASVLAHAHMRMRICVKQLVTCGSGSHAWARMSRQPGQCAVSNKVGIMSDRH